MEWIKQHKILFAGLVIGLVAVAWYGLTQNPAPEPLLTTVTPTGSGSPTQQSADQELVATLLTLRAVTLSGTIFDDPAFMSLRDFGTTIVAEPVGRPNPFAPLGSTPTATSSLPTRPTR